MSALIGAYHARNQTKKAFESRIERAKRGIPTCGKLPFARAFDKDTGTWIVDEEEAGHDPRHSRAIPCR